MYLHNRHQCEIEIQPLFVTTVAIWKPNKCEIPRPFLEDVVCGYDCRNVQDRKEYQCQRWKLGRP